MNEAKRDDHSKRIKSLGMTTNVTLHDRQSTTMNE